MSRDFAVIGALTHFSVGTIAKRDAMMVIELATSPDEFSRGIRHRMPIAMTPDHPRARGEALLLAAAPADTFN